MARTAPATYDVIVIGGGASGLAAALTSARAGARTAIVECDVDCGLPILATGNGRCNLSNERLRPARYRHPVIARAVLGEHPEETLAAWFDSIGIWTTSDEGRLYPMSKRAESVRDALLAACERADVAKLCALCLDGDFAAAAQEYFRLADFFDKLFIETNPIPVKAAMNLAGMNVGKLRLPLVEISEGAKAKLIESMHAIGLKTV